MKRRQKGRKKPETFVDWLNCTERETDEWIVANSGMSEIKKEWFEGFRSALIQAKAKYLELGASGICHQ